MPHEAFTNVFFQYAGYDKHFSEADILNLAQYFVFSKGMIDIETLIKQLSVTKKDAKLVHIPTEMGIQASKRKTPAELRAMRKGQIVRQRPGLSTDCTSVAMRGKAGDAVPPYGFVR
jgi:hypothetical protein